MPQESLWRLLQASHGLQITLIRAEAQGRIDFGDWGVKFRIVTNHIDKKLKLSFKIKW